MIEHLKEIINNNQFLSGGLVLGAITSILYSLKAVPGQIWHSVRRYFFYSVTIEQTNDLFTYVQRWLMDNYEKELRSVRASYIRNKITKKHGEEPETFADSEKRDFKAFNKIIYIHHDDSFRIYYKNRIIRIATSKEKFEGASNVFSMFFNQYTVSGIFARKAITELLEEFVAYNVSLEKVSPPKMFINQDAYWEEVTGTALRDIDKIFIDHGIKDNLLADINNFKNSYSFYQDRNIPYRRGYLLEGPPGTGKSSLASALASKFNTDLYLLNLNSFEKEKHFESALNSINSDAFILIEDIDAYFKGREAKTKISFSSFINQISGVKSKTGIILLITTNVKSEMDDALLRSGRIDMQVNLSLANTDLIEEYLSFFYSKKITLPVDVVASMADIENICIQNRNDAKKAVTEITNKYSKILEIA